MMYLLLLASDALFALQFLFERKFRDLQGDSLSAALISMIYSGLFKLIILLVISGFRVEFSMFSFWFGLIYALLYLICAYESLKALATANLSIYSVFMMLGGMLLPFFFGIIFLHESLTIGKIACVLFILISLLLTLEKGGSKKGAYKHYFSVFVLNGLVGVVSTIHQTRPDVAVNSDNFLILASIWSIVISLVWYLFQFRKLPIVSAPTILNQGGYSLCNGLGCLFSVIALTELPASVLFPIGTGGTMVFSTLLGLCLKEKLDLKKTLSLLAAVVATILVIL